jgi:hypothetical protein
MESTARWKEKAGVMWVYVFHSIDDLSKRHNHKAFAAVKSGEVVELEVEKVAAIEKEVEPEETDDDPGTGRPSWRPYDDEDDLVKKMI